jgi:hypothetical protein
MTTSLKTYARLRPKSIRVVLELTVDHAPIYGGEPARGPGSGFDQSTQRERTVNILADKPPTVARLRVRSSPPRTRWKVQSPGGEAHLRNRFQSQGRGRDRSARMRHTWAARSGSITRPAISISIWGRSTARLRPAEILGFGITGDTSEYPADYRTSRNQHGYCAIGSSSDDQAVICGHVVHGILPM